MAVAWAVLTPRPGSVLPGPTVTFKWTANRTGVRQWQLSVGSKPGQKDLYSSGVLAAPPVFPPGSAACPPTAAASISGSGS